MSQVQAFSQRGIVATIASGQTVSSLIDMRPFAQGGFILPAAFTGASISFLVATEDDPNVATFAPLYDSSNALVSLTVIQGRAYAFPISLFPFAWVKLVSGSAEGGARSIKVITKY